jgi:Prophage tail length tape measure protein
MSVRQVAIRLKPEGGAEVTGMYRAVEAAALKAGDSAAAATEKATAAAERQEAQWRRNAEAYRAAASAADAQDRFNSAIGVGARPDGRARDSAAVFEAAFANDDAEARRAAQIRAEIDPLWAAQDRYNRELAETNRLRSAGKLTDEEAIRNQDRLQRELDQTTAALNRNTGGLTRNQVASRLNLARQGADVAVTAAMGMNPGMIAIQQGPQILDAWATSGLKVRTSMFLAGSAIGALAIAAGVGGAAFLEAEGNALALERAATGLGRTSGVTAAELETMAMAGADQANVSVRAARDQAAAWVSTGKIQGDVIAGMLAIGKDYAAFFNLDASAATEQFGKSMAEPDKAARDLTRSIGLMDQATLDHIDSLVKQGDRTAAQKILLEALTDAVDGHAARVGTIESAWDAVAMAASNAFDWIGKALMITQDEAIQGLEADMRQMGRDPASARMGEGGIAGELARMRVQRDLNSWADEATSERSSANQAAQEAIDRRRAPRRARGDRSAEREERERLQRERREEDRQSSLDMAWAEAIGDTDGVRALKDEVDLRQRIRQLIDDGVAAETARTTAQREQGRLLAAREITQGREQDQINRAAAYEADRELGLTRTVALEDRRLEVMERITSYAEAGRDYYSSWLAALNDQLQVDQARAEVMERQLVIAERQHRLTLANLSGRTGEARMLDRESRIEARAREIENREKLDYGAGADRAGREIDAEIDAQAQGVRREWTKDFIADIRQGGIREALAEQFETAADRLIDRLIDMAFDIDWSAMLGGKGGGKGGGIAGQGPSQILSWLGATVFGGGIGRNASGTDYWSGGWSWVGEEGPELVRLPRGSAVASNPNSIRMMSQAAGAGRPAPTVAHYHINGNLLTPEFWERIQAGDRMAARVGRDQGAQTAVGFIQSSAPEAQRGDRMLKS